DLFAARNRADGVKEPRLLAPSSQREPSFGKEEALDGPFAGAAVVADLGQRATVSRMGQNFLSDAHGPAIRWPRQLQRTAGCRLKLMEQCSEQGFLVRHVPGPGWCLTGKHDEFLQERVDVQNATRSGKLAHIPRSEIKRPHRNGSRHRDAVNGTRGYPYGALGWDDPEPLPGLDRHDALRGEDQL